MMETFKFFQGDRLITTTLLTLDQVQTLKAEEPDAYWTYWRAAESGDLVDIEGHTGIRVEWDRE